MRVVTVASFLAIAAPRAVAQDHQASGPDAADSGPDARFDSPQTTMFTFLEAMKRVNNGFDDTWDTALACLDLSRVDPGPEPDSGRELAVNLLEIFNRLGEIKREELPDATLVKRMAEEGEPIRSYRFFPMPRHNWIRNKEQLGGDPDGTIELATDDAGAWRFSAQTVAGIDALYASMRRLPLQYRADVLRRKSQLSTVVGPTFDHTTAWGWAALAAAIFLGLLAGKITQASLRHVGNRWKGRDWQIRGSVFDNAASPASLALLGVGLMVGLQFIYMEADLRAFSRNIVQFLLVLAVGWFLYNLVDAVDAALRKLAAKTESKLDDQLVPLIRKTLRIFLIIVFTLFVAQNIFDLNITGWLAGLGIAGLAVSLAAQDSVKNLFGSVTIFFDNPFAIGDFVVFGDHRGVVEEIGFRSTRLRLLSGHVVSVPNMKFIDNDVENISARPHIRRQMDVTITYDTPPEKIDQAVRILRDILNDPDVVEQGRFDMENSPPRIAFNELNADSLNIRAYYWYKLAGDPDRGFFTYLAHCQVVNTMLFRSYGEAGIEFAFPTQTLYLAGDPARRLSVDARVTARDAT